MLTLTSCLCVHIIILKVLLENLKRQVTCFSEPYKYNFQEAQDKSGAY